jgi:hypothetical protein
MYTATTILKRNKYAFIQIMLIWVLVFCGGRADAQVYANTQSNATYSCNGLAGCGTAGVTGGPNAVSVSLLDSAVVRSAKSILGLGAGGNTYLQLNFPGTIPAGSSAYIKIGTPTVTGLVTGLLGILSLSGSSIYVDACSYNGTSTSTVSASANNNLAMIRNASGELFLKITPPAAAGSYNSLQLKVEAPVLELLVSAVSVPVYYGMYDNTTAVCSEQPVFTDIGSISGVSVNLSTAVVNPQNAIDASTTTYSVLTTGTVTLGGTTSQTIFYNGLSSATDEVRVLLSIPPSILNLGLFNNIKVQTFNGTTATSSVQTVTNSLLGLDLLTLFGSNAIIPVYFKTTSPFDRIVISTTTFVGALGANTVNIYDVKRVPATPVITSPLNDTVTICQGTSAALAVDAPPVGITLNWYASSALTDVTVINTGATYTTPVLNTATTYWVAAKKTNCPTESDRVPMRVLVNAAPSAPSFAGPVTVCKDSTKTLTVTSPATNTVYRWYKAASGGTSIFTGNAYTTSALAADTTLYVDAYNTVTTCTSISRTAVAITVTTVPNTVAASQSLCSGLAPAAFTSTLPATTGSNTFQWQQSTDNLVFTTASGTATGITYTAPALSQTTYYRRVTTLSSCASRSNVITVTVSPLPAITYNNALFSCLGDNAVALVYTNTTGSPNQYSITWTSAPAGLPNVTNATLTGTSGNISLQILPAATVGVYNGVLTVKNSGCTSTNNNFSLTIQAHPSVTPVGTSYQ